MKRLLGSIPLFIAFVTLGCNKPMYPAIGVGPDLSPQATAGMNPELQKYLPHPPDFINGPVHGSLALQYQSDCMKCHVAHAPDQTNRTSKLACTKCHDYPHVGAWATGGQHGRRFLKTDSSAQDHAEYVNRDFRDQDWKNRIQANRNEIAARLGRGELPGCLSCHGEKSGFKKRHPDEFVSCDTCHTQMPHPLNEPFDNTEKPQRFDHSFQAQKGVKACMACHVDLQTHPTAPRRVESGCFYCHDYNWKPPAPSVPSTPR